MIDKLIATIRERFAFAEEEAELLRSKMTEVKFFDAGQIIVPEGKRISFSSLLVEGLSCRSKYLKDGSRQITQFNVAGDFVDLHSYPLEFLDHSITAISDCKMVKFAHRDISEIIKDNARIARILWFMTMVDASIHREWLVSLGARAGAKRIAHLLCEMYHRLRIVGLTDGTRFEFPVTQAELGEALGFSPVHTSRMLAELRERRLATLHHRMVEIENFKALEEMAEFDPGYLCLHERTGVEAEGLMFRTGQVFAPPFSTH